jgi:broad specificity phosphatase PhoE
MADQVLLLRHAVTEATDGDILLGRQDAHLGERGERQAKKLARAVSARKPDRLIASPLSRAQETADPIAESTGLEIETETDLQEIDFGRWGGQSFDQIRKKDPELVEEMSEEPGQFTFPQGERIADFWERVAAVADRIEDSDASCPAIVSHGGVIRGLICHLIRIHPENYLLFKIDYASISAVDIYEEGGVLAELNNTSHLERS